MSEYWLTTETNVNAGNSRRWFGPFETASRAEKCAEWFSKPETAAQFIVEVVYGTRGMIGQRTCEYVNGQEYNVGESPWWNSVPPCKISIPEDVPKTYPDLADWNSL